MFRSVSRWRWLTILAICNLLVWVGMGVAVGLAVSGHVDLGVETFVREQRATAMAVWGQAATRTANLVGKPTAQAPASQPTSRPQTTRVTAQPLAPTTRPPVAATATPEAKETPVRSPLLLADPEFKNLAGLDAELGHSAVGRAVQIRYQEDALNRAIAALVENNPKVPYRHIQVDLKRDEVVVTGSVDVLSFPLGTRVVGRITAKDCLPQIEVHSVSIAGVFTPSFVRDRIVDMLLQTMTWYPADYPLCLQQIVLEEDRATVYGIRR